MFTMILEFYHDFTNLQFDQQKVKNKLLFHGKKPSW